MLDVLQNPYFIIPAVSWFVAQLLKFGLKSWQGDTNFRYFFKTGNMPSSHTAIVTALVITAAFESGLDSPEFGISFVVASIVTYDAFNLRRAVGEQGGVLTGLIARSRMSKAERDKVRISEVLGHSPIEVVAGASLGVVISFLLEHDHWSGPLFDALETTTDTERTVYTAIAGGLIAVGLLIALLFSRRHLRKLPTSKRIARFARASLISPGLLALLFIWLEREGVARFTSKVWLLFVAIWVVTAFVIGYIRTFRGATNRLVAEKEHFSQEKKRQRQTRRKKKRKK